MIQSGSHTHTKFINSSHGHQPRKVIEKPMNQTANYQTQRQSQLHSQPII